MRLGRGGGGRRCRISRPCVSTAGLLLAACVSSGTPPTPIEVTDRDVAIPSLRVAWDTSRSAEPSSVGEGLTVELDLAAARGRDSQGLAAGQDPIVFNGVTFSGPQTIGQRFDFFFTSLAARWRFFFGESRVGVETLIGGGYSALDLRLDSGSQRVKDELSSVGVTAGFGVLWRAGKHTTLQARFTSLATFDEPSQVSATELVVTQALARHVKFRGGYARWEIEADNGSDIEVKFAGPVLGLELDF